MILIDFKLNKFHVISAILIILMFYYSSINQLNQTNFIILGGALLLVFILSLSNAKLEIDLPKARTISLNFVIDEQRNNRIPKGYRLYLPEEAEKKSALVIGDDKPTPLGFDVIVGAELQGKKGIYLVITVSKYGEIEGVSGLPLLETGAVKRTRPTVSIYTPEVKHFDESPVQPVNSDKVKSEQK